MSETIFYALIVFAAPFLIYLIFRIGASAVFRSFFEQKRDFEKKGDK